MFLQRLMASMFIFTLQNNHEDYFSRKYHCSILLHGVVAPDLTILNVFAGVPVSVHDARLLWLSHFNNLVDNSAISEPIFEINENVNSQPLVLGNLAYNVRSWLVVPSVKASNTNDHKIHFNKELSQGHAFAENVFATLKGRWKILQKTVKEKVETVAKTVMACSVLQNMFILLHDDTEMNILKMTV